MTAPHDLPPSLHHLADADWRRQTIGRSNATVFRVTPPGGLPVFVKTEPAHPLAELPGEIARLRWLATTAIPAPTVITSADHAGTHWLAMSALPGADLSSDNRTDPETVIPLLATALRELHEIDIATCPFDHRLDTRLADAARNAAAGRVDETDFDDQRLGLSAADVLERLLRDRIAETDLVVTHGDASLPNFMAEADRFTGLVDCGRLGIANRWQDLAIACTSIAYNFDAHCADAFLRAYGIEKDLPRFAYYQMLNNMF